MQAHLVFAERASLNSDGTFSVVRGGLSRFESAEGAATVSGDLLMTIEHGFEEFGVHELRVTTIGDVSGFNFAPTTVGRHLLQVQWTSEELKEDESEGSKGQKNMEYF